MPKRRAAKASAQKGLRRTLMHEIMHAYKYGQLHSGSSKGPLVRSRAQAIAIGLSVSQRGGLVKDRGKSTAAIIKASQARRTKVTGPVVNAAPSVLRAASASAAAKKAWAKRKWR